MSLAQTWLRQSVGAAGASLLAPLAIIVAAGALAASSGFGGLSGIGQITSGPSLPGSGLAGGEGLEQADIVGAEVVTPSTTGGAPAGTTLAGIPGATTGGGGAAPVGGNVGSPLLDVPTSPGRGVGGGGFTTPSPVQPPGGPGPLDRVVDGTRQSIPALPEPVGPVTEDILNLLLGPPPE